MTTGKGMEDVGKAILTIEEAAMLLGVSMRTFIKILREGDIPARKVGREWRFSRTALIEWIGAGSARDYFRVNKKAAKRGSAKGAGAGTEGWDVGLD